MPESPAHDDPSLSLAAQRRIDRQCVAFENAWKSGERPAIERFLEEVPEPERDALLRELRAFATQPRFAYEQSFLGLFQDGGNIAN